MRSFTKRLSIGLGLLLAFGVIPVMSAGAQVKVADADFSGYSTGTDVSVAALRAGTTGPQVVDGQIAFSGATVASKGTTSLPAQGPGAVKGQIVNEVNQVVQPAKLPDTTTDPELKGNLSYARGAGLEVGLGQGLPTAANDLILAAKAQQSAPPSGKPVIKEVGPVPADPIAYASLLRGTAQARWNEDNTCILGEPISAGIGYAADAQLVDAGAAKPDGSMGAPVLAADAPTPDRSVSQSFSYTMLAPQTDATGKVIGPNFGLLSQTRQTIAPVTLLKGTANEFTIEVAGEWVLSSVATGVGGAAGNWVHYGPAAASPQTSVVRIIQGGAVTNVLSTQDLLGATGLVVAVPGVAEIAIGEDPRAIGGDDTTKPKLGTDGTSAATAVDVVRVKLLEQVAGGVVTQSAADIRVGHMESAAKVPVGGIACSLPVTKSVDKPSVAAGDTFTYTITVLNPFADCDLKNVKVTDTITTDKGIKYSITGTTPTADSVTANTITWNDIGPIKPKQTKATTVSIAVDAASGGGVFSDTATATGTCATGSANGGAAITVPVTLNGAVTLVAPDVVGTLAKTGGTARFALLAMGMLTLAGAIHLGLRRRSSAVE